MDLDLSNLSLCEWNIIKKVYSKRSLSLQELQEDTKYPYYTVRYHCKKLCKRGLLEKNRSSCCCYNRPSSNKLRTDVMNEYYALVFSI